MASRSRADKFRAALEGRPLRVYSDADLQMIASATGTTVSELTPHRNEFNAAWVWFRLASRIVPRTAPSLLARKLSQIEKAAARLLSTLGIDDVQEAADGPPTAEVLEALAFLDGDEDAVTAATARIGRLTEILEAMEAARDLERRAKNGIRDVRLLGRHVLPGGHHGYGALNEWVADMMALYRTITGKDPATSVGPPASKHEGEATGPLIRFLEAAAAPLGIEQSPDALRSRIRAALMALQN